MRIAIITFHRAHNYGAVIQAYALQQYFISNGHKCEIIDFNSNSQRDFNSLYPRRNGIKSLVKNVLMLPYHKGRKAREKKFKRFVDERLILTDKIISNERELKQLSDCYDFYVSGSDQIWNVTKKADSSKAYFLNFVGDNRKKIAYAVSLGNATQDDLTDCRFLIEQYAAVSAREEEGTKIISMVSNRSVDTVLDPTLLVKSEIMDHATGQENAHQKEDYIFYYSLDGFDTRKRNVEELRILSKRLKKKVVVLAPEWPKKEKDFVNIIDAGPEEFLALIKNAYLVCTNSFHGTALSIVFNKNFYVLDRYDGLDSRKTGILKQLDLMNRMVQGAETLEGLNIEDINYIEVNDKLNRLRYESEKFIMNAIQKQ